MTSKDEISEILTHVSLFSELKGDRKALDLVAQGMRIQNFQKGHYLAQEGEPGAEFFILTEGKIAILKKTLDGDKYKVVVLDGSKKPSMGEGGLLDGELRSATILCETEAQCIVWTKAEFAKLCEQAPQIALPIFRRVAVLIMGRLQQTSHDLVLLHKALMDEIRAQ